MNNNFQLSPTTISLEHVPGELHLIQLLQKPLKFSINNKLIKSGRLLLFRRVHYFIQLALLTEKGVRENFEIPIPFRIESHEEDNLLYFDYRLTSLGVEIPQLPEKVNSIFFDRILEIDSSVSLR